MIGITGISRVVSSLLGFVASLILLIAVFSYNRGDIKGLGSLFLTLYYLFFIIIATPFLLWGIFSMNTQVSWFKKTILGEAGFNMICGLSLSLLLSTTFLLLVVGNIIPFLLFYYKESRIIPDEKSRNGSGNK